MTVYDNSFEKLSEDGKTNGIARGGDRMGFGHFRISDSVSEFIRLRKIYRGCRK